MTNLASVSTNQLGSRRRQLRRQRQRKIVQLIWQGITVSSLTGGLFWMINQPFWLIRQPEQIKIEGNQLLSDQTVRSILPLSYPQSLWQIQPQALAETLETKGQIAKARVTRELFPPSLMIEIQERSPVAIAQEASTLNPQEKNHKVGWLDALGGWMPLESYSDLERSSQLPSLKVIGNIDQYRPYWPQVYEVLSRSPVNIYEINWLNPSNIILKTEIGEVHIGPFSSKFAEQLRIIDRMRKLPEQVDSHKMEYIDLKNPAFPLVQMPQPTASSSSNLETENASD